MTVLPAVFAALHRLLTIIAQVTFSRSCAPFALTSVKHVGHYHWEWPTCFPTRHLASCSSAPTKLCLGVWCGAFRLVCTSQSASNLQAVARAARSQVSPSMNIVLSSSRFGGKDPGIPRSGFVSRWGPARVSCAVTWGRCARDSSSHALAHDNASLYLRLFGTAPVLGSLA